MNAYFVECVHIKNLLKSSHPNAVAGLELSFTNLFILFVICLEVPWVHL